METLRRRAVERLLASCEQQWQELRQVMLGLAGRFLDEISYRALQFSERGGKAREILVRHNLDDWTAAYLERASLADAPKASPLFRAGQRRGSPLTEWAMSPLAVQLMLKRRLRVASLPEVLSPHSFRIMVVTDLLSQNVPLEHIQYPAGHAHPRTTQIYDRCRRRVSRNLVERISV